MKQAPAAVAQVQIVAFRLGEEEFGLDVFGVHEILRYRSPTPVPRAPEFVEGVIDVRGSVIPVVDLRRRFELVDPVLGDSTRIVVVDHRSERLGLIVDAVTEVLRVPETAVSEPPAFVRGLSAEYVRGLLRLEERLVVLIDIERILSSDERIALSETELDPQA